MWNKFAFAYCKCASTVVAVDDYFGLLSPHQAFWNHGSDI